MGFTISKKPERKIEPDDCEIEVKRTRTGKRIRFRGKCSREQISTLSEQVRIED